MHRHRPVPGIVPQPATMTPFPPDRPGLYQPAGSIWLVDGLFHTLGMNPGCRAAHPGISSRYAGDRIMGGAHG